MTSDGEATNVVFSCRCTHYEDGLQGLWLCTKSKEAKDEVKRENQLSLLLPPLPFHSGRDLQAKL